MNPQTLEKDIITALKTFFGTYFDGATHSFGGTDLTFPECDIAFGRPQLGAAFTKPRIQMSLLPDQEQYQKAKSGGGFYYMIRRPMMIHVITNDVKGLWDTCDNVQNLIGVILNGARADLTALGLKVIRLGMPVQAIYDETHDRQISRRTCLLRYEITYPIEDEE